MIHCAFQKVNCYLNRLLNRCGLQSQIFVVSLSRSTCKEGAIVHHQIPIEAQEPDIIKINEFSQ